jgi:parvulin-like peptidyl-prolyl isomerase
MIRLFIACMLAVSCVTPLMASEQDPETIAAVVNNAKISVRRVEQEAERLIPLNNYHRTITEERKREFTAQAIDNLIVLELKYQDAVAKGLKPDKKQVKNQWELMRKKFSSKKDYQAALENAGITEEGLKRHIEKLVLADAVRKQVLEPAAASEAELKDYYGKNSEKFRVPESVKLREISTKDENKLNQILALLRDQERFDDVAAKMSEDKFRVKGGDVGYIHRGRILPEVEAVAFTLKVGEISAPIKAESMWYIVKVEDKKAEYQLSFEESKGQLKKDLEKKRADALQEKWISDLRAKAKVEILLKVETTQKRDDKKPEH